MHSSNVEVIIIDMVQQLSINSTTAEVFLPKIGHIYKHNYDWTDAAWNQLQGKLVQGAPSGI